MLDQGLNPQWLAMEGSRILDEKRHRGEDLEEQGESLVDLESLLAEVNGEPSSQPFKIFTTVAFFTACLGPVRFSFARSSSRYE